MTFQLESGAPIFRTVCIRCAAAADFFCHCQHLRWAYLNAPGADKPCRCGVAGRAAKPAVASCRIRRSLPVSAAAKDLEKISGSGANENDSPDFGAPIKEVCTAG